MRRYKVLEVSESQLEDLVRQAPELIEAELRFVDHQAFTDRGRLDVLLVDSGGALVVAELKVAQDDAMLVQGLDYYDYVARNLDGYCGAYAQHGLDPQQEPRLLLIAPSFSVTLLNRIKWIEIPVSLFTVQCIEFADARGEIVPVYTEVRPPAIPEKPEPHRLEDRYKYMTDPNVQALARSFVAVLQQWDAERVLAEATKYDISVKISGRVAACVSPRRKHFLAYTYDAEGKWTGYPVHGHGDVETLLPLVRDVFEKVGGRPIT